MLINLIPPTSLREGGRYEGEGGRGTEERKEEGEEREGGGRGRGGREEREEERKMKEGGEEEEGGRVEREEGIE